MGPSLHIKLLRPEENAGEIPTGENFFLFVFFFLVFGGGVWRRAVCK